jgi:hypothetical protein
MPRLDRPPAASLAISHSRAVRSGASSAASAGGCHALLAASRVPGFDAVADLWAGEWSRPGRYYNTLMYRPEPAMDGWAKVFSFFSRELSS